MRSFASILIVALALTGCGTPPAVTGPEAEKLQAEAQQKANDAERQHQKQQKQQTKSAAQTVDEAERQHQRGTR